MTRIAYRFFALTIGLLIGYTVLSLIAGVKTLPGDTTQGWLPLDRVNELAEALLELAITGGLIGGGIYALATQGKARIFRAALWLWVGLTMMTLAAGVFNLLSAGSAVWGLIRVIVIGLVLVGIGRNRREWTPIAQVWIVGMSLSAICILISLIPTSDVTLSVALHTLSDGVNVYVAQVLAAVALIYWLIGKFSTVDAGWAALSLSTVAGLLSLAGALVTLSTLEPLGLNLGGLRTVIAILVPLLTLIFGSHTYLAFSHRNATDTLAAHWAVLGVILILLGMGMLGGLQAPVRLLTTGTRLGDLQPILVRSAVVAILLGVINQAVYEIRFEMRGQDRRVTGLAPFWLVAFGMIGGGLMLAGAGLVQVYLERVIGIDALETQALIATLYGLWVLGLALMTLGLALYGLIHWLRRPRFVGS